MTLRTLLKSSALLRRRTSVVLIAGVVLLLLITTYAKRRAPFVAHVPNPSATVMQNNRERVETESITIEPHGFEPAEITRPYGRFRLGVDNRSGLEDIQLRLERADGGTVPALESRKRRLSWHEEVDLPPGRYVIRETNHPEWTCLITITSR